jgi:peptidoglycan hydrolase-like protein with peptidoglycan-binding domain
MAFLLNYKRADRVSTIHVQNALAAAGHAPGPADGRFGLSTMKAVVAYQNAHGLDPTGMVDEALFGQIVSGKAAPKPKAEKKAPAKKAAAKPAAKKAPAKKPAAKKAPAKKPSVTT